MYCNALNQSSPMVSLRRSSGRPSYRPVLKYIWAVIRFLLIILNNLYCIPTHVLWLTLLLPARKYVPALYYRIEQILFSWLLAMVSAWSWSAGYNIVEVGADITECLDKRTLVMVNHQSTADVPMLMAAFNAKPNVLQQIMWIMDRAFQYTNFGIVSSFHLDFFIASVSVATRRQGGRIQVLLRASVFFKGVRHRDYFLKCFVRASLLS